MGCFAFRSYKHLFLLLHAGPAYSGWVLAPSAHRGQRYPSQREENQLLAGKINDTIVYPNARTAGKADK